MLTPYAGDADTLAPGHLLALTHHHAAATHMFVDRAEAVLMVDGDIVAKSAVIAYCNHPAVIGCKDIAGGSDIDPIMMEPCVIDGVIAHAEGR